MSDEKHAELSNDLINFIDSVIWTYAKTMPDWPHEYIVRGRVEEEMFVGLVEYIRKFGYEGKFFSMHITYFDHDGMTYWTMGAPLEETIIINRCKKAATYEVRLAEGRLPK